jgi:hypothetical protein
MLRNQRVNSKPIGIVDGSNLSQSTLCALLTSAVLICPQARASEAMPPKLYEVTTETRMPHLEDNLRYADTREKRCLSQQDLATAFPILKHESLKGCKLDNETRNEDTLTYLLSCEAAHGKTGRGQWQLSQDQLTGRLDVRMGGKNMTFYQRVTAKPVGECVSEAK